MIDSTGCQGHTQPRVKSVLISKGSVSRARDARRDATIEARGRHYRARDERISTKRAARRNIWGTFVRTRIKNKNVE